MTTVGPWLAAFVGAVFIALCLPSGRLSRMRLEHVTSPPADVSLSPKRRWLPVAAVVVAGLALASFVGGFLGLVAGVGVAAGLHRWMSTLPQADQTRRYRARTAELPVVTDLLAACLASGASVSQVLPVVSEVAVATRTDLRRVSAALQMGASPDEAWDVLRTTDLHALATVMRRSSETGAPAAFLLSTLANELRADARAAALSDARRLGVRSAGPLGLCFLPAFILIGVVPLVISLVSAWA